MRVPSCLLVWCVYLRHITLVHWTFRARGTIFIEMSVEEIGGSVSHFRLEQRLGVGGMGVVYRAVDERLGRRVALKFIRGVAESDAALADHFLSEARTAASLDHPNICTIFEVDRAGDDTVFIAMAYYDGETLDKVIARGPIDVQRAVAIAIQIGRGLAAAHEELVVHRDVKPTNIMLLNGDTVKILDFGLATMPGRSGSDSGQVTGTIPYMSPEQLKSEPVDPRSDTWALGVVLYEMIAGVPPFRARRTDELILAILRKDPPPLSKSGVVVPSGVDPIIRRALAKNPRLRYDRIDAMLADLLSLEADLDSGAVTARRPVHTSRSSIAVLPFADMTPTADQGYLCDGIAEEILRALSRIPDLYVASRTSSFQFKGKAADIREIGAKLNVDNVLEGSVRRAGNRVRISAQLINVADGYRLWNDRYDREMKDIFSIEEEIADQIAAALRVTLVDGRRRGSVVTASEAEAYELYLKGREFFHQHRRKGFEVAIQTFRRVIDIDPLHARAFAGIADCNSFLRLFLGAGEEAVTAADEASRRALELDPDLPEAHAARGFAQLLQGDLAASEQQLQRAIELDPRLYDPHYIYGRVCFSQGRNAEAAKHFRQACSIVPEAYDSWYLLGMCYRRLDSHDKALSADLECIEAAKSRVRNHPENTRAWTMGAAVLAELGEPERAVEWIERALAIDRDEPIIVYNAACVYTALNRFDDAIACLRGTTSVPRAWIENDPDMDPLRNDPRFKEILAAL